MLFARPARPNSQNSRMSLYTDILEQGIEPIIYEELDWFVILANKPMNEGHLLVIPKQQVSHFQDAKNIDRGFQIVVQLSRILQRVYECPQVCVLTKGFSVNDHAHIHVCPLYKTEDTLKHPRHMEEITLQEQKSVADKLRQHVIIK